MRFINRLLFIMEITLRKHVISNGGNRIINFQINFLKNYLDILNNLLD